MHGRITVSVVQVVPVNATHFQVLIPLNLHTELGETAFFHFQLANSLFYHIIMELFYS